MTVHNRSTELLLLRFHASGIRLRMEHLCFHSSVAAVWVKPYEWVPSLVLSCDWIQLTCSHLSSSFNQNIFQSFHSLPSISLSAQSLPYTLLWAVMASTCSLMSTRCCRTTWSQSQNPNSLAPSSTSRESWRLKMEVGVTVCVSLIAGVCVTVVKTACCSAAKINVLLAGLVFFLHSTELGL